MTYNYETFSINNVSKYISYTFYSEKNDSFTKKEIQLIKPLAKKSFFFLAGTYFKGGTCPSNIWEGGDKIPFFPPNLWQTQGHCPYFLSLLQMFFQRLLCSWDQKW